MQSLQDIMGSRNYDTPPEVDIIKNFVRKHFSMDVSVTVKQHSITITTQSAGLAGSLRPMLHKLKDQLQTDKKLFIKIG